MRRIAVTDTGTGIRSQDLARLFVPLDRIGDEWRAEGTGLGLSLAQKLVHAMGGDITVDSAPGEGSSTFAVILPVATGLDEHAEAAVGAIDAVADGAPAHSVLYVEDNLSNLTLVQRIFDRRSNLRLVTAMQGRIGLDLARDHQPDLILLDLHLPDIDGVEVLMRLRSDPRTAGIPVIVLSADATPTQVQRLLAAGARAYVTKPLAVTELLACVDKALADPRGAVA